MVPSITIVCGPKASEGSESADTCKTVDEVTENWKRHKRLYYQPLEMGWFPNYLLINQNQSTASISANTNDEPINKYHPTTI